MIKIGSTNISSVYLGNKEIGKVYLGNKLVYQKTQPIPPLGEFFLAITKNAWGNSTNTNLAYTFDGGNNWSYKQIDSNNPMVRVSQDLSRWVISGYGARGWYSLDYGNTLNIFPTNLQFDYATISNDGNVIACCTAYGRKTYRMVYPFTSRTLLYSATQDIWTAPSINYNGSLIIGRTNSNKKIWKYDNGNVSEIFSNTNAMGQPEIAAESNYIYINAVPNLYKSTNRGASFTLIQNNLPTNMSLNDAGSSHISNNGEYFIMNTQDSNKVRVFSDYGNTYKDFTTVGGRCGTSCSSSGKYMVYTAGSHIYVSTDYGQNFQEIELPEYFTREGNLISTTIEDVPNHN